MRSSPAVVLVVEDDAHMRRTLAATLKAAGYKPVEAASAAEGKRWLAHYRPDLVLLDLGLPDADGTEVIRAVRAEGTTPILILSARDAEQSKVDALDLGADDYLTKPYGVDELLARVRAALRHGVQAKGSAPVVTTGALEIDLGAHVVRRDGVEVALPPKAFAVLAVLAGALDRTVNHADILRAVWGDARTDQQYLRVHVGQLRAKLEDDPGAPALIVSVPGVGYRLKRL